MKILGVDYGIKGIRVSINNDTFHIYLKRKGLSIYIMDIFKIVEGESIPTRFNQEQIMDFTIVNIAKSIISDIFRLFKRLFGKI